MIANTSTKAYLETLGSTARFQEFKTGAPNDLVQQVGKAYKEKATLYGQAAAYERITA
jgi:hypothetical protein